MSKNRIEVYTCDRCGAMEEIRQSHFLYQWGRIIASEYNGPFRLGFFHGPHQIQQPKDMCPKCTKELADWWKNGQP